MKKLLMFLSVMGIILGLLINCSNNHNENQDEIRDGQIQGTWAVTSELINGVEVLGLPGHNFCTGQDRYVFNKGIVTVSVNHADENNNCFLDTAASLEGSYSIKGNEIPMNLVRGDGAPRNVVFTILEMNDGNLIFEFYNQQNEETLTLTLKKL